MGEIHPHDIGMILITMAWLSAGQPLMARLGVPATARASLALYHTREEIDALDFLGVKPRRGARAE